MKPSVKNDSRNIARVEFNKKLFKSFQGRGIEIGAIAELETMLISDHLIEKGLIDSTVANSVLEEVTGIRALDPSFVSFDKKFVEHVTLLLPGTVAREEMAFPVKHENADMHVVMAMPQDQRALRRLSYVTGSHVVPYCCNGPGILAAIEKYYEGRMDVVEPLGEKPDALVEKALQSLHRLNSRQAGIGELCNDAHFIRLFQHAMNILVMNGASDLHMEPRESDFRIRYRKDGVMQVFMQLPAVFKDAFIHRLKMIAGMESRGDGMPQDGSIRFALIRNRDVDIRVSSLPSLHGEKIVMRVLESGRKQLTVNDLGMETREAGLLEKAIQDPSGLILVTGPTGSGKTTTLYAMLHALNTDGVNIVTAEDPVEYKIEGLVQVNCPSGTGLTFGEALRAFMRQDPDIVMVGEIRDAQTADAALKAAMTGHLVLSTLHTNDAPGTITRLISMGVPPYLVASARMTVIAQRLLRRLCPACKQRFEPGEHVLKAIGVAMLEEPLFHKAVGCERCSGTGYDGRFGIYELMRVTAGIVDLVLDHRPSRVIMEAAVADGMVTLRKAALRKMAEGHTTIEEVYRVTLDDEYSQTDLIATSQG